MPKNDLNFRPLLSDQDYFDKLVKIVVCSGLGEQVFKKYLLSIEKYFSDFRRVAAYTDVDALDIFRDEGMLHNLNKIMACISNAKRFVCLCDSYGSMEMYFSGFDAINPHERYQLMSQDLTKQFKYLGEQNVIKYIDSIYSIPS